MATRNSDSTLSGSSSNHVFPAMSSDVINPGITPEEYRKNMNTDGEQTQKIPPQTSAQAGSGSDLDSDSRRLQNPENLQDKVEEDTFPASDPPSTSPMTGVSRNRAQDADHHRVGSDLPADFKDNKAAQFEYGRKSQHSTEHFDRTSKRLENGNPDIGEVDLGTIDANKPSEPDDSF